MGYIVGAILIIITLLIIGLILRKRIYDEVDRQDEWKLDILNRNVAAEISQIKKLNLSGETQDKFENWKQRWENIITKKMSDIEENLLEAEESADRYRFAKAKKVLRDTDDRLSSIEKEIENILKELEELMATEKSSREDAEKVAPGIKTLKKKLTKNRYQYGKAETVFEQKLQELDNQLDAYESLTEDGNYMEAKELMETLKNEWSTLHDVMEAFPGIYRSCKHDLPNQLSELKNGLTEMKNDGFVIDHLGFEAEIKDFETKLDGLMDELNQGEITATQKFIPELEDRLKDMYQMLEDEVIAKGYVHSKLPGYRSSLEETAAAFAETKDEVNLLAKAYYILDDDMEKYHELDQQINKLQKQYEGLSHHLEENDSSNIEIREQIERGFSQLQEIKEKHDDFKKYMENIRGDEMRAREQLSHLREQIHMTSRRLNKSNIPGVPGFIYSSIEKATQQVDQVLQALERQPLDMAQVQAAMEKAKIANDSLIEQTDTILDQAYYTERVIQYANRYRSRYSHLAAELKESERLFRSYEYELALEKAARAVEEIEPGALKKIEHYQEMDA